MMNIGVQNPRATDTVCLPCIEADVQKVLDTLQEVEPTIAKAEEAGKAEHLSKEYLAGTPDKEAVATALAAADSTLKDAQSELSDVRSRLTDMVSSADEDVKQYVQMETRKVDLKVGNASAPFRISIIEATSHFVGRLFGEFSSERPAGRLWQVQSMNARLQGTSVAADRGRSFLQRLEVLELQVPKPEKPGKQIRSQHIFLKTQFVAIYP